ncbi:MAG TPA: hypothetical protein VM889_00760 [Candidatus Thermoplasmatota archaeon]|nr:hypothetical protein [Candidatus Thermoplasmatota archaeon]
MGTDAPRAASGRLRSTDASPAQGDLRAAVERAHPLTLRFAGPMTLDAWLASASGRSFADWIAERSAAVPADPDAAAVLDLARYEAAVRRLEEGPAPERPAAGASDVDPEDLVTLGRGHAVLAVATNLAEQVEALARRARAPVRRERGVVLLARAGDEVVSAELDVLEADLVLVAERPVHARFAVETSRDPWRARVLLRDLLATGVLERLA